VHEDDAHRGAHAQQIEKEGRIPVQPRESIGRHALCQRSNESGKAMHAPGHLDLPAAIIKHSSPTKRPINCIQSESCFIHTEFK
jgi:hypothetical protein